MSKWEMIELNNVCSYVSERIGIDRLTLDNYVSTENMISNKEGIFKSSGLPKTNAVRYRKGDVLVSNIRPYFKKIWSADREGGCSADVLNFRANENYHSKFLYYVLSDDEFFRYSVGTSRGTKMPRGDKAALLKYSVPKISIYEQERLVEILSAFDNKIKLNKKVNDNLDQQAQAIFDSWFGQYMYGELPLPAGWALKSITDINVLVTDYVANGSFKSLADNVTYLSDTTNNVLIRLTDYNNNFNTADMVYISDASYDFLSKSSLFGDEVIISNVGANAGTVFRCPRLSKRMSLAPNSIMLRSADLEHYLYLLFTSSYGQQMLQSIVTGSAQPKFNKTNFRSLEILVPDAQTIKRFNDTYSCMYEQIAQNKQENIMLSTIRDALLPKLMSGELDVSEMDI